jgi:L-rhamnose isomerase/sugar isomerase
MSTHPISSETIGRENEEALSDHEKDLDALAGLLERRGVDIGKIIEESTSFEVAVPSWGFSQGGTRFGRFPIGGEPRDIYEKMVDAAVVNQLTGVTPRVSLHLLWDKPDDPARLRSHSKGLGLSFDAVNSNTFQDQPNQEHSYKFGSLSHTKLSVRDQAIDHNIECIEIGERLGSKALTVWLADGGAFPGQIHLRRALDRTIDSLSKIYQSLPPNWRLLIEYKPFEPAFYSTVVQDWGTSLMIAQALGSQAACLMDLGHHLPNCNVELVVARLISAGRLGGFHFNDSKFADDDLSSGSIRPYQLFLVFNELVDAMHDTEVDTFNPSYMIDQSHTVKDPIEDLTQSAIEIHRAYTKALLVDRDELEEYQKSNDVVMAERTLKQAYETDVSAILAEARRLKGAALDPLGIYRRSGYREQKTSERGIPPDTGKGIV